MDLLLQKIYAGFIGFFLFHNMIYSPSTATATIMRNETDRLALLAFKDQITGDPFHVLSSWNESVYFCQWPGVACSRKHQQRVTALNLTGLGLVGLLSPFLANLTFLRFILLSNNSLHGEIPPQLGSLFRLKLLDLNRNLLEGEVPTNISHCFELRSLDFSYNRLVGTIPFELGSLPKLNFLNFYLNNLSGTIPPSLGNLSSLITLTLGRNNLQGMIPHQLGQLSRLQGLLLGQNRLSGIIPPSLYNLTNIVDFEVVSNQLSGQLWSQIGIAFPNLEGLYAGDNHFTGSIPLSLSNASHLRLLALINNFLTGSVPVDIGKCQNLTLIQIGSNVLGTEKGDDLLFITSLTNCSRLQQLGASYNSLHGLLPDSIGNLSSQLQVLLLGGNRIYGTISPGIENLVNLQQLAMEYNSLTGSVPAGIGRFKRLEGFTVRSNRLSGQIPASLGNLTSLAILDLSRNLLQGQIPSSLVNCRNLYRLGLSFNRLSGVIPTFLFDLTSLTMLVLSYNFLSGSLPVEVGKLVNVYILFITDNLLVSDIPDSLGSCVALEFLNMAGNSFTGAVPTSLSALKIIQQIDLSRNQLSGTIPHYFAKFVYLQDLNLSYNNFEGEVPKEGIFSNGSIISLEGNNKLCGGIKELRLLPCPVEVINRRKRAINVKLKALVIAGSLMLFMALGIFAIYWRIKSKKKHSLTSSEETKFMKISYTELLEATNGFSATNLIGTGSFSLVYKGVLARDQMVIAVKVLKLDQEGSMKSFMAECAALRNIRHRNLIKILTYYSGFDAEGKEFKAIIYEFMPNGTLESWLHPRGDRNQYLNLKNRLNIAIDVANALDYLHNQCHTPIVHCDLKPNNILLDEDMVAHVGDFGLAKILFTESGDTSLALSSAINLRGTIGYIPPEYGTGHEVTTMGDVYSFGVFLLEIFMGKKPSDGVFKDGLTISKHAKMAFPNRVMEIVDPELLLADGEIGLDKIKTCLVSLIRTGIICSSELPSNRMDMRTVRNQLQLVQEAFLGDQIHSDSN